MDKKTKKDALSSSAPPYPLAWPSGWPKTEAKARWSPRSSSIDFISARDYVLNELKPLRASNILISSNMPLNSDGYPFIEFIDRKIDDPGVAVFFFIDEKPYALACDAWEYPKDNLRAIGNTLGHIKATARNGAPYFLEKLLSAFAVDTKGIHSAPPRKEDFDEKPKAQEKEIEPEKWWQVLGVTPASSLTEIEAAFRMRAREAHPDRGGSPEKMQKLNEAVAEARKLLKTRRAQSA